MRNGPHNSRYEVADFSKSGGRILATDWKHGEPVTMEEYEECTLEQWEAIMAKHGFKRVAEEKDAQFSADYYYYAKA